MSQLDIVLHIIRKVDIQPVIYYKIVNL